MKQNVMQVLVGLVACFLISCKKNNGNTDVPPADLYTVSGAITDASGKPVSGARVRAENSTGNNIHITGTSDAEGKYSLKLSAIGGWKIYAWKEVTFESQTYQVRLGMEKDSDYDAFSVTSGIKRNFVWKLNGRIPDRTVSKENGTGFFGGTVKFINYNSLVDVMPPGTEVTIRFTPAEGAKYLDGSSAAGKTVERKFGITDGVGQAYYINDIPATNYVITATSTLNGTYMPVYLGGGTPDEFYEGFEYTFQPEAGSGSYESGLGSPNEYSFYILHTEE